MGMKQVTSEIVSARVIWACGGGGRGVWVWEILLGFGVEEVEEVEGRPAARASAMVKRGPGGGGGGRGGGAIPGAENLGV